MIKQTAGKEQLSTMSRVWIVLGVLLGVGVVFGPFVSGWKIHDHEHVFKLGEYGNWLQGALTPLVIIIAVLALRAQIKSQRDAIREQVKATGIQVDANRKLLMGIMLDKLDWLQKS